MGRLFKINDPQDRTKCSEEDPRSTCGTRNRFSVRISCMNNASPLSCKPAVTWPGGKSRLLKHILPLIPKHTCYVEPFAGGLAVMLAKPRSAIEVLNDLNGDLVTFYRCVRFHSDSLLTELEFVLNSRQEFTDFITQIGLTDIQRAARWFFRNRNCFRGANLETFGVSPSSSGTGASSSRAIPVKGRLTWLRSTSFPVRSRPRCCSPIH